MKAPKALVTFFIAVALVLAAAWAFLVYGAYSGKAEMAAASADARKAAAQSSHLFALRTLMREEKESISAIENMFVREEDLPSFVEFLENKASDLGVDASLGSLNLGSAESGSAIAPLSVSVSARGTWQSLVRFIDALDTLPYASKVESASLVRSESSAPEAKSSPWSARIEFVQYVVKADKK